MQHMDRAGLPCSGLKTAARREMRGRCVNHFAGRKVVELLLGSPAQPFQSLALLAEQQGKSISQVINHELRKTLAPRTRIKRGKK